jgi:hypothetical protein
VAGRSFRMYGKKRGNRRTGSKALASVGEAAAFLFFLVLGTWFMVLLVRMPVLPEWRANHDFVETTGVVKSVKVGQPFDSSQTGYRAEVQIEYVAGGQTRRNSTYDIGFDTPWAYSSDRAGQQALIGRFELGKTYPCWYDPRNPDTVVVARGYSGWLWSLLVLPATFIVIGGGGLIYAVLQWGKSAERLAAQAQLAGRLEQFDDSTAGAKDFPNVPRDANLTNSPGTRLKYRLPIITTYGWRLAAVTLLALVWNGIVIALMVMAVRRAIEGRTDAWLFVLIVPFLAGGLWLIYFLVRQVVIASGVGPTQLEVSDHPLFPGRHYDLLLSQAGRLTMKSLVVDLVCEEQATFRQGTDTRTHGCRVYQKRVFDRHEFDIPQGLSFQQQCRIEIPAEAMHSFRADHNEVQWKFVVRGEAGGWPPFERSFPIVVYPKPAGGRRL